MPNVVVAVTTSGSAGAATANVNTGAIRGTIRAFQVDYVSMPATTDVTITEVGGLGRTLITLTNANTDKTVYPLGQAGLIGTGADITGVYAPVHISGALNIAVAQADAGTINFIFDVEPD
jgi:hypothetical protein